MSKITLQDYKKKHLHKNSIAITCRNCKETKILQDWYETENLLWLCPECYQKLKEEEKEEKLSKL